MKTRFIIIMILLGFIQLFGWTYYWKEVYQEGWYGFPLVITNYILGTANFVLIIVSNELKL